MSDSSTPVLTACSYSGRSLFRNCVDFINKPLYKLFNGWNIRILNELPSTKQTSQEAFVKQYHFSEEDNKALTVVCFVASIPLLPITIPLKFLWRNEAPTILQDKKVTYESSAGNEIEMSELEISAPSPQQRTSALIGQVYQNFFPQLSKQMDELLKVLPLVKTFLPLIKQNELEEFEKIPFDRLVELSKDAQTDSIHLRDQALSNQIVEDFHGFLAPRIEVIIQNRANSLYTLDPKVLSESEIKVVNDLKSLAAELKRNPTIEKFSAFQELWNKFQTQNLPKIAEQISSACDRAQSSKKRYFIVDKKTDETIAWEDAFAANKASWKQWAGQPARVTGDPMMAIAQDTRSFDELVTEAFLPLKNSSSPQTAENSIMKLNLICQSCMPPGSSSAAADDLLPFVTHTILRHPDKELMKQVFLSIFNAPVADLGASSYAQMTLLTAFHDIFQSGTPKS